MVDVDASEIWLTVADDADYAETLAASASAVARLPRPAQHGRTYADDRMTAVSASTGDDLVVRVSGEDYATLQSDRRGRPAGDEDVEGVISPAGRAAGSQPTVSVQVDLAAAQRSGSGRATCGARSARWSRG